MTLRYFVVTLQAFSFCVLVSLDMVVCIFFVTHHKLRIEIELVNPVNLLSVVLVGPQLT